MPERARKTPTPLRRSRQISEPLQVQARRQATVAQLGQRALQGLELPALLAEAATFAASGLEVELSQVLERELPSGTMRPRAGHGWRAGAGKLRVGAGTLSHAGFTLQAGEPVIVTDFDREKRFAPCEQLRGQGVKSGVGVTIAGRTSGQPFGVLAVYSTRRRSYSADDVHFLVTVANVLAAAVIRIREQDVRQLLLERVMSAQEDERRRIARELHDETAQVLTTLLVGLRTIEDAPSMPLAQARANHLAAITTQAIASVGRLARGLHPSVLQDLGLGPALHRHADEHAEVLGIQISVEEKLRGRRLTPEVETSLFRIAQEAIANVGKHAHATQAWVSVRRSRGAVVLEVEDDGCGFAERALSEAIASGRLGLQGIRERAAFLGGDSQIDSQPGSGTRISVRIPLAATSVAGNSR